MAELSELHAVVTGGGGGIGSAIAYELAVLGAEVTLMGRNMEKLNAQAAALKARFGDRFYAVRVDVKNAGQVRRAFEECTDKAGEVHILVNNAGFAESSPFMSTDRDLWEEMLAVNLMGANFCIKEVLSSMLKAGYGRIINVSSTAGLQGYPYVTAYCASKHALLGLTRSLALELKGSGVTVNAICPGFTDTDLFRNAVKKVVAKTRRDEEMVRKEILGAQARLLEPREVGAKVAWLCLKAQSSFSGQAFVIKDDGNVGAAGV